MSAGAGAREIPIVLLASAPWATPAPVNVHQIARRMAARGHRVLFVESTGLRSPALLGSGHDRRRVWARLRGWLRGARPAGENLWVLSPLALPAGWPAPLRALSERWLARSVARCAGRLGLRRPVVWAFLPTALAVARRLDGRRLVYHCVDRYAANPGVDAERIAQAEAEMLAAADRVLAASPELAAGLRRLRPDAICLPNVADVALFGRALRENLPEPPELAGVPRPRAIYVGNLAAYRVDFRLLAALARSLPDVHQVLVGAVGLGDAGAPSRAWRELVDLPNVHAFGPRPQETLPAWLRHADVALIPFLDNEHTRASLPLKLWEYLAAGLPVVASDLPNFGEPARAGLVRTARGAPAFAEAVRAALAEPAARRAERHERARAHDWPARIDELERLLADEPGGGGPVR